MEKLTVLELLEKYEGWVKNGEIQFLQKGSEQQKKILKLIRELHKDFKSATDKQNLGKGDVSANLDWHETHRKGRDLWHELASSSLNDIDESSKGNSKLFDFLEAATRFEDLLYGLEPYYRDHTLHSLWVYFIGEYILRDCLPNIYNDLNWYLFNDVDRDEAYYKKEGKGQLVNDAKKKEKELCAKANRSKNAIWCIMALCHDLGYSLSKLNKLNERVQDVLSFFDLPDFQHIGYSLDVEHQYIVSQFLELMAMDVRIVPDKEYKEVLIKCYRDDSTYWRLCRALEKKQHGILSAYLIYKILGIFADTSVRGPAEEWGLEDTEAIENIIRGDILFAMAQHQFDFAHLNELNSLADILMLADELEEFSRYGREMLSRRYHDTTAEARISFKPNNPKVGQDIEIDIIYESKHRDKDDISKFFIRKSEQLCKIYSLEQGQDKKKYCTIKSIKMTVEKDDKKIIFHFCRDCPSTGFLPSTQIKEEKYQKGEYMLTCFDDKLYVELKDKKIPLEEWMQNAKIV